jgi:hypothetical protein
MKSMIRYFGMHVRHLHLFAVACVGFCVPVTNCHAYSPRVGQVHPDFTLPRLGDGEAVSLSQFRGRKVLLVHFASW